MIRYAITDRALFEGEELERRQALVRQAERLSRDGVDYLQVREKDLGKSELVSLVEEIVDAAQAAGKMKVLVNSSLAVAEKAGAAGVHFPPGAFVEVPAAMVISAGARNVEQVNDAVQRAVTMILFSPVFGKSVWGEEVLPGVGLDELRKAVVAAGKTPVIALGGITPENAQSCIDAGAAGVAGIRMFLGDASNSA